MSFIKLDNVSYAYDLQDGFVLKDLSLELEAGQCLIVEGDNGAGKSTLFRVLNGLAFPQKGSYEFDGIVITDKYLEDNVNSKGFHKRVGYLFQNPDVMLFNNNVYDEIAFGPRQMGLSEEEIAKITNDCLQLFMVEGLQEKAPYHLSGGQKKKVALASVMALNPEVLILDEPLAGLDRKSQAWFIEFLKELKQAGKTIIIATHEDELKKQLGDKELVL